MRGRGALILLVAWLLVGGCRADLFGAPGASPSPSIVPATTAAPTLRFVVDPAGSLVTVRVREQLVSLPAASDAVLTTSAISGQIGLTRDGRLTTESALLVDLTTLASDEPRRDTYVKQETLDTRRFPTAELGVVGSVGLPQPLPQSGEWRFSLVSTMTLHDVTREITWEVTGQRVGREIRATARTTLRFADFALRRPVVAAVLSVQDEIRMEVLLRAVQR